MANWENFTVRDIVGRISNGDIVLPVIQRRLVWEGDKMEALFDSLFQQNSFGSIICIEEESGLTPLFAHRSFTQDGNNTNSVSVEIIDKTLMFVIDGQQRLQSFYIGLCGTFEGKTLHYDLFSDYKALEHDFKFAASRDALPKNNSERSERIADINITEPQILKETLWLPVPLLFTMLKKVSNYKAVATRIFKTFTENGRIENDELKELKREHIVENVRDFKDRIFLDCSIGISKVEAHMCENLDDDRRRIVEMFQRLNSNGTRLSPYDLVASTLRGFDYRMESFLDNVTSRNENIGIDQDFMIKMLLVLHDKPNKGMTDMTGNDATFATQNIDRIQATLDALRVFLKASRHEEWFESPNRSSIPLYFLAYHIFYKSENPAKIRELFAKFDTNDKNFQNMSLWLKLSLLNQVFRKGCGWRPDTTGMNKIHEIMQYSHGGIFPLDNLLNLYKDRLHNFFNKHQITPECLDTLDQEYIFYLIYGGNMSSIRQSDKDHIHPRVLLEKANVSALKINSIGNLQLINSNTNRGEKNSSELKDWINSHVSDKQSYISRHLIPEDENLWTSDKFTSFLRARLRLLTQKIKSSL